MTDIRTILQRAIMEKKRTVSLGESLPESIKSASPNAKVDLIEVFDLVSIVFTGIEDELCEIIETEEVREQDLIELRDRTRGGVILCDRVIEAIRESMGVS